MEARVERASDERRMAAWRRADVDEVKLFARQQIVDRVEPFAVGTGGEKGVPARLSGVSRSDDPDIFPGAPAGHAAVGRDIAKADERAPQHGLRRLSRARIDARWRRRTDRGCRPRV